MNFKTLPCILLFCCLPMLVFAQDGKALHHSELKKYLPSSIAGYSAQGDPEGMTMEMNDMSYSQAHRDYRKGDSELNIMLIDYREAAAMYMQSTAMWQGNISMEDDHTKSGTTQVSGYNGWETYDKDDGSSQLMLGINDRYLLTLSGDKMSLESIKSIAGDLKLGGLPD